MATTYVPNFTKKPVEMLLGLINNDNNLSLTEVNTDIQRMEAVVAPDGKTYDTSVDIDLLELPSEVVGDFVTFYYTRIALATLFSQITASFREVDVPLDVNGLPVDNDVLFAEILRKYGVAINADDYTVTAKGPGVITVSAAAGNMAYTGSFDINIVSSLATRVAIIELEGFVAPTPPAPVE